MEQTLPRRGRADSSDEYDAFLEKAGLPPDEPAPRTERHLVNLKYVLLAVYFFLNLALTLSNKALLGKARFPWLLTTLHTTSTSFGCFAMVGFGSLRLTALSTRENLTLVAFSVLFTLNIALSNVSLSMISVPLHQILRSMCPIVTIWIYRIIYKRTYSSATYLSMIPLVLGIVLTTAGDYYCTLIGFIVTVLGVLSASVKTVATNRIVTGSGSMQLSPSEVLLRMSPLAAMQCVAMAFLTGEVAQARTARAEGDFSSSLFYVAMLSNAGIAFALNVASFQANKLAGALTMTVCGNVKQALTIGLGFILFHIELGWLNAAGAVITILGGVWYSKVELDSKKSVETSAEAKV